MKEAGIIVDASFTVTSGGWIKPFFCGGGENHRFTTTMDCVATRQEERRPLRGECSSFTYFPLFAACDGGGRFLLGFKGILFSSLITAGDSASLSMPRGGRHAGGADTPPMGYNASPEILQIITSTIAGVTTVVRPLWAASPMVRIDVWIDNIRIAGSISDATLWEAQVLRNADSCHASMGEERESGATQYTFLGVQFDHTHRAVSLSDKFVRCVCAML
ncbi:hypothetical protein TCSYLVIO_010780, partial [Trypanosoma cruzi]